jgi:hypothetical protein
MAYMDTTQSSPVAVRIGREERKQALLLAAQSRVNPDTGRLPADQVKEIYADLAAQFNLEPSSVATYLPSTIKPTSAETLAYARSRRSAKAAQRREEPVAPEEPVVAPPEPSVSTQKEAPKMARVEGTGVVPASLGDALAAFAASLTAAKDQEITQLRERIAALEADNERLMAEVYRLNTKLGKVQEVLGNGNTPVKSVARPLVLKEG